jgi:hypothetical protein
MYLIEHSIITPPVVCSNVNPRSQNTLEGRKNKVASSILLVAYDVLVKVISYRSQSKKIQNPISHP